MATAVSPNASHAVTRPFLAATQAKKQDQPKARQKAAGATQTLRPKFEVASEFD